MKLPLFCKDNADGAFRGDGKARKDRPAAVGLDREFNDSVAVFVRDVKFFALFVECHEARRFSERVGKAQPPQVSGMRIDRVRGYAVMNPVRGVSEAASRVDQHRARLSLAGVVFGQRTQYLLRRDLTGGGVEVKAGDAVPLFVDETAAAVARVKREMARFVVSARLPAVAEREGAVFFDTVKVERARAGLSALNRHDEKVSLDWYLADEPLHKDLQKYYSDLLHVYQKYPALWQLDSDWNGFQWINANDGDRSIFSFIRRDETGKKNLLFIINFTPVARDDYRVGVPKSGTYSLILDSEHGLYKRGEHAFSVRSKKSECDGQPYSFAYPLPAYGAAIFKFN